MRYSIFFVILSFLFISCGFNLNESEKDFDAKPNIVQQSENTASILDILSKIDRNYVPTEVSQYFNASKEVSLIEKNDYTEFLTQNSKVSVAIYKPDSQNELLIFYGYEKKNDKYVNYFYFLRNMEYYWSNVTQLVITDELLQKISNQLGKNLQYHKDDVKEFYAYYSAPSDFYLKFIIKGKSFWLYKCKDKTEVLFLKVKWQEGRFVDGKVHKPNVIIDTLNNSELPPPISDASLDKQKRYTDLTEALRYPQNVYILDLTGLGIDSVPSEIKNLKKLQILILNDNFLETLPKEICELPNLQIIRASDNNIHYLPSEFGKLKNLEELTLNDNHLEYLPVSISKLKKLKILNLGNNNLKSLVIDFSQMPNLTILDLSNNKFVDLPTSLMKLKNLQSLDISGNPIKALPHFIFQMKTLSYINLKNTQVPQQQIEELENTFPDAMIVY